MAPRRRCAARHLVETQETGTETKLAERIVLLPGDGIGPEVTEQARRVLVAAGARAGLEFEFIEELIGGCSIDAHGTPLREEVIEACQKNQFEKFRLRVKEDSSG